MNALLAFYLAVIVASVVGLIGYVMNIFQVVLYYGDMTTNWFIIKLVGILVPFAGAITGWMGV